MRPLGALLASAVVAVAATAAFSLGARADGPAKKKDDAPAPLAGKTTDFDYDAKKDTGHAERRYVGRAFVHSRVAPEKAVPILVFLHGLNVEKIKFRWMGGGQEGDVRRIVSELMESGQVPPLVVAGPSSIDPNTMINALATWPAFDLDTFLDNTQAALGTQAKIDRSRVIVAGHSGAGCNVRGGISTALHAKKTKVLAGLVIDVCMGTDVALDLTKVDKDTNVVVSWQEVSWTNRPTNDFRRVFQRAVKKTPASPGILRELELVNPNLPSAHDAMVGVTLKKWLPRFLPRTP